MILDLRQPMLVIAGAFNPAIFTPPWLAANLYKIPEGQDVDGVFVTDPEQQVLKPYINKVAVLAQINRLSIFVDDVEDNETLELAKQVVLAVAAALPHTPVAGLGVNFLFRDNDPDGSLADKLAAHDAPEKIGEVVRTETATTLKLDENVILNFTRSMDDGALVAAFNYHATLSAMSDIGEGQKFDIKGNLERSLGVLSDLYGLDGATMEYHRALN